ncbi:hypothetical protein [Dankookia sp. P2]|uniref:hypothetical protein n=1 Tax=Dankookia sp. P2 TaxID=3423955 RepID=UPI003D66DD06
MQASPLVFAPSIWRKAAARSKPRAIDAVRDVDMAAGFDRHLEDLEVGHALGQRRPGAGMHDGIGSAGRLRLLGQADDQFLVLVVDGTHQPGSGDLARKAASMVGWSMRGKRTASYS